MHQRNALSLTTEDLLSLQNTGLGHGSSFLGQGNVSFLLIDEAKHSSGVDDWEQVVNWKA